MIITKYSEFLKLLEIFEEFFDGTLGTQKIDPEGFKLKENTMPTLWLPYPLSKIHK